MTLTVTDVDAVADSATVAVDVANAAPLVHAATDRRVQAGAAVELALGSFADPGADSPWSVDVDWGDGSPAAPLPDRTATGSLGSATHTYRTLYDAQYTVVVKVTDKDGAAGTASYTVRVDGVETQVETLAGEIRAASIPATTERTLLQKLNRFLAGFDASDPAEKAEACDQLEPFAALLKAKTGKDVTAAQAARWTADATRVGDLAGC